MKVKCNVEKIVLRNITNYYQSIENSFEKYTSGPKLLGSFEKWALGTVLLVNFERGLGSKGLQRVDEDWVELVLPCKL